MVEEPVERGVTPASSERYNDIYTVANIITMLRLILVPIFFAVFVSGPWQGRAMSSDVAAFLIFALAASTDWIDGQIARRTGTVTAIGRAIDPVVDRMLIAAGVLGLYVVGRIPLWLVAVLLLRDLYLFVGSILLAQHRLTQPPVIFIGKLTTALLLFGFSDLVLNWPLLPGLGLLGSDMVPGLGSASAAIGIWFVYAGTITSIVTAVIYTVQGLRALRSAPAAGSTEGPGGAIQ